jgi:hypothetical protein
MFNSILNKRGISLIEVMIAFSLTSVGVLGLISMQPQAWRLSAKSDFLGRAGEILHEELETNEVLIMNPCNAVPLTSSKNVFASGQGPAQAGDVTFTVQTTIRDNGNNTWTVAVRVTWPGNNTGISESLVVTRQEHFRFPQGCV